MSNVNDRGWNHLSDVCLLWLESEEEENNI